MIPVPCICRYISPLLVVLISHSHDYLSVEKSALNDIDVAISKILLHLNLLRRDSLRRSDLWQFMMYTHYVAVIR